jgi:hypothetical protein
MQIGTRITYPEEAGLYDVDLLQISIYHGMKGNLRRMKQCVETCREKGIRYVIHPVLYSILDKTMFEEVKEIADGLTLGLSCMMKKQLIGKDQQGGMKQY